jgi:DTW domain-containing protein YfiP
MSSSTTQQSKQYLTEDVMAAKRLRSEQRTSHVSNFTPLLERFRAKDIDRTCPKCSKDKTNNKVYCYNCLVPVGTNNPLPKVELPIKLDILRHPKELKTKSTALHAQVLCGSEQVRTVELPEVDQLTDVDPETTVLLFPTPDALALDEVPDLDKVTRVVVIDSTWQQANAVLRNDFCKKITRRVKLAENHPTSFWRPQRKGDDHLATIEAMYYFFKERFEILNKGKLEYDGRYDNMLYIFMAQLRLIEDAKRNVNNAVSQATEKETESEETETMPAATTLSQKD